VKALLDRYEKEIPKAPIGKSFAECYDPVAIKPTDDYVQLWEGCKKTLSDLGLDFKLII
jgi:hypothetical protein